MKEGIKKTGEKIREIGKPIMKILIIFIRKLFPPQIAVVASANIRVNFDPSIK